MVQSKNNEEKLKQLKKCMGHPGKFGDSESLESLNKKFELNVINQHFSKAVT